MSANPIMDYHQRLFMTEVRLLTEQHLRGIEIDVKEMYACRADLQQRIGAHMNSFLNHPDVAHHIEQYNRDVEDAWRRTAPPQFKKDGTESARYQQWLARKDKVLKENVFNPNSKPQLADLFYIKMGYKPQKFTPTGRAVVDKKTLPLLGEAGRTLNKYNLLVKRRGYTSRILETVDVSGRLYPQFNSVGTVSTRLGGSGGINFQQLFKEPHFLSCFRARDGHKLVQADAEALEPVILAEFSQDPALLALYGPGAKTNDVYLFVASKIPGLGDEILKYYDPNNPTPEGIKLAKTHCKRERSIAKLVQLSSTYGAGAKKIHETLTFAGIDITFREVRSIHAAYWKLFAGVKRFERQLLDIWSANGGWIPSILGTPIAVSPDRIKDIISAFCQTSGHLFLQIWIYHIDRLRRERGAEMYPWMVDLHDEVFWEVPDAHTEAAAQLVSDALDCANAEVAMDIKIKGPAMIVDNMGEVKCEDYYEWLAKRNAA